MTAIREQLVATCRRARAAARALAPSPRGPKDAALEALAKRIEAEAEALKKVNAEDVEAAREAGLSAAMIDRLVLDDRRIASMADGVRSIAAFDDPVGASTEVRERPNGIRVSQVRIPLGVIAMIYESRPNVTVDAAALCLKSGNAVLLRGGKEAKRSNAFLGQLVRASLEEVGLPGDAVQIIEPMGREETKVMIGLSGMIDLLIPRGGEGLIRFVAEHARVPVVQHYKGVCHLYVDEGADVAMAMALLENGKLQRPGVCNALECVLVHESLVDTVGAGVAKLIDGGLEVRADAASLEKVPGAKAATDEDWGEEFLAPVLAFKTVAGLDEALEHIGRYGSLHTEVICTPSEAHAARFKREVDASCVMVNASSRFNDGSMLGLGAEVGISTTKLHAYGPMGLASLTALKWVVEGEGQIRA